MSITWAVSFSEITKDNVELVGGKGARLGEMLTAGFNVPPGFCITTQAYRDAIVKSGLQQQIREEIRHRDFSKLQEIKNCGQNIRQLFSRLEISSPMRRDVEFAFEKIWPDKEKSLVAIRSSATMEDLPDFSFAGQHDTYLNVKRENLWANVINCWASLWTDRAIAYRYKNNLDHMKALLSVVVQQMVPAQSAGILFTLNPVTNRKEITINAGWGLGEFVVSGQITPDEYLLDDNLDIIVKNIAEKKRQLVQGEKGNEEKAVPEKIQKAACLSDTRMIELATIGQKIEKHYQAPQDIEWAIVDDNIYILQSRPITTGKENKMSVTWAGEASKNLLEDKLVYWSNWNVRETLPYPLTHYSWSMFNDGFFPDIFKSFFGVSPGSKLYAYNHVLDLVNGRLYWNMNMLYGHPLLSPVFKIGLEQIDETAGRYFNEMNRRGKLETPQLPMSFSLLWFAFYNALRIAIGVVLTPFYWSKRKMTRHCKHYWQKAVEFETQDLEPKSDEELVEQVKNFCSYSSRYWASSFLLLGYGSFTFDVLSYLLRKWDDISPDKLVAGVPGNKTTEAALELYKLSEMPDEIKQIFLNNEPENIMAALEKCNEAESFLERLENFMDYYGHRSAKEFDAAQPRWSEDPTFVFQMIKNYLQLGSKDTSPTQHFEKIAREREEVIREIRRRFSRTLSGILWKRILFDKILILAHRYIPFRENPKYYVLKGSAGSKRIVMELGKRLEKEKILEQANDIFHLTIPEMQKLVENKFADVKKIVAERKKEWNRNLDQEPPFIIRSDGEIVELAEEDQQSEVLKGTPVSTGRTKGIARIILDPKEGSAFNKGEILVAPFTDPGWTPLFLTAKAFIMEVGGVISHGAIVAREYGIPAVVGVKNATKLIQSGDEIIVDGDKGLVLLSKEQQE